jgi:uroporphyrinogen decarboxylase
MTTWNKRRRLEAAIAGEPADRPPVALWRHWPGDDQDAAARAAAHVKWQADYNWDLVKVSPASSYCLVDWGVEDRWEGHTEGTRTYTKRVIHDTEDWARLEPLDPGQGMLATQIETLRLLGREMGDPDDDGTPFIATVFNPLAQAKNLAGGERMLGHMRRDPEAFRQGLKTITASTVAYVEAAMETGVSGIYFATQHACYNLLSPEEYQLFGRPYDEAILAAAAELWLNVGHIHGDEEIMFDLIADYPLQVLNWHDRDGGFSLAEGQKQTSAAVSGGVSRWTMHRGTPEAVVDEARDAVAETGGRRLLLGTGCVIMTNTPLRNIRALREFVESAG